MSDLLDTCLRATERTYPAGYGFALTYLRLNPGPRDFKAMREQAMAAAVRDTKEGGSDGWRFMQAYAESCSAIVKGWPAWLVEAAQVVLADAIAGNAKSAAVMALWQHPGY